MPDALAAAIRAVRESRPIVYPTDTLWGLGVRPADPIGVARLLALKGRPEGMPVSVAFAHYEDVEPYVNLMPAHRALLRRYLPGPYTVLLRASDRARREFARAILGDGTTLGVRIPDHPVARSLLARAGPLTSTSANAHGDPPCQSAEEARSTFGRGIGACVTGGPRPRGRPSALVAWSGGRPHVLRRS
jgi:L-threonylcarbamoyladenylate synthase